MADPALPIARPRCVLALRHLHRLESGFSADVKLSTLLRLCERFAVAPAPYCRWPSAKSPDRSPLSPLPHPAHPG